MTNKLIATNPATGEIVREVTMDTEQQLNEKIALAQKSYLSWKDTSFEKRAEILKNVAKVLRDDIAIHAKYMTEEMGKPVNEAYGEVEKAAWCAEHYADNAAQYLEREVIESDATLSYVEHLPLGTILGILPWNAPYWLAFRFCAPALMAGNTCVMKADSHVPGCAQGLQDAFIKAGAPKGIFQSLFVNSSAMDKVMEDDRIHAVSFTGSSYAGAKVAAKAASEIKPAVLELGGSDPCIVLADADLESAADIITLSRIINAGQSCIAAKRIIVEAPVYEKMVELLKQRLEKLKMGDPANKDIQVGPIARANLRDELHRQVDETIKQGGKCLLGGAIPEGPGFFYPVTLLTDVDDQMCAFKEETFGPVAVVIKADSAQHALEMANDTPYGLASSVWSQDLKKAEEIALKIEAGQVSINGIVKTDPRLPSGGIKKSGYGRELGPHGIKEFVNAKQVWIGPKK